MKNISAPRALLPLFGILFCAFFAFPFSLAAKGNKVPFIRPDGTRQEAGPDRGSAPQRRMWEQAESEKPKSAGEENPAAPKPAGEKGDGIEIDRNAPADELRFTVTLPKRYYAEGEYRPNRPAQTGGRAGKTELKLNRAERGSDEIVTVSVKSPVPDWKRLWTPLHSAAASGDTYTIKKTLTEKTVSVDASREFLTPLHVAAALGEEDAARLLLQNGANITVKTPEGKSAADLAALSRHPQLARLLTVFTVARELTDDGKTVSVSLDRGERVDLTAELRRIAAGYQDEHRHDASVFGNYEGKLPRQDRYYYTEFVYRTNSRSVGPRRVVIGMKGDVWYTPDHYNTFVRVNK